MEEIKLLQKPTLSQLKALLSARLGKPVKEEDIEEACIKCALRHIDEIEAHIRKKGETQIQHLHKKTLMNQIDIYEMDDPREERDYKSKRKSDWNKENL